MRYCNSVGLKVDGPEIGRTVEMEAPLNMEAPLKMDVPTKSGQISVKHAHSEPWFLWSHEKSSSTIWWKSLYRFCWTSTSCQCEDCPPRVQSDARKSNSTHFRQKLVFLVLNFLSTARSKCHLLKLTIRLNFPLPFIIKKTRSVRIVTYRYGQLLVCQNWFSLGRNDTTRILHLYYFHSRFENLIWHEFFQNTKI